MIRIADRLDEIAALAGDEDKIAAWLAANGVELKPDNSKPKCPTLRPGEVECDGKLHYATAGYAPGRNYPDPRRCGYARYGATRMDLADRLAACGYGLDADEAAVDISEQLLAGVDIRREVAGLQEMLAVARDACAAPLRANTALTGSCGTAKTQCLLAILFSALKQGHDALFVPMAALRALAQKIDSFDYAAKTSAIGLLATLSRVDLLVLDDLADRESGRPTTEGVLLDILSGHAVTAFSSNLTSEKLKEHADVGPRVVSRLYADRTGNPVRGKYVHGPDQRQHGLRTSLRVLEGGRK